MNSKEFDEYINNTSIAEHQKNLVEFGVELNKFINKNINKYAFSRAEICGLLISILSSLLHDARKLHDAEKSLDSLFRMFGLD